MHIEGKNPYAVTAANIKKIHRLCMSVYFLVAGTGIELVTSGL